MMTEQGRVLAIEDDGLWVETYQKSACDQCSAQKGCGQSLLAKSLMQNMHCVKACFGSPSRRIWKEGDTVVIGIEESVLLWATFVSYFPPLIAMLAGAGLASILGKSDAFAVSGAFLGLASGFLFVRWYSKNDSHRRSYHAVVIE